MSATNKKNQLKTKSTYQNYDDENAASINTNNAPALAHQENDTLSIVVMLIASLVFFLGGIYMVANHNGIEKSSSPLFRLLERYNGDYWLGWFCIVFCGLGIAIFILMLITNRRN